MHTIALGALQVIEVIDAQDLVISQVVLGFDAEQGLSAHGEVLLKADQCADILVVSSDVIEQRDHALAVHSCLDA